MTMANYRSKRGRVDEVIQYLEKDEWKFGSGYAKAGIIGQIRKLDLKDTQAERLRRVVLAVVEGRDRREFRHYCRLASKVDSLQLRKELMRRLEDENEVARRHARWVLEYLSRHQVH